ncbi:hypothetical protein Glove_364g28 [Diversispora epigaea]|uniref:Uncharacterized protein n=1 Tax=Diversispora epigaea TaxID=1348612 RepID=A0A397H9I6_9GLOM|nr:hypothetical protein Glove_364g28 [Diversispora epigaea]
MVGEIQDNNEYIYVRSSEDKDIIEVQDFNTQEILYKKMRQKDPAAYCSQLVDPISEVLLAESKGKSSKDKSKKILLYQPDVSIDFKDTTGLLGPLEFKFTWEGEIYLWKKRFLSKEMECKMVHGDDPGIRVALFRPASNSKKTSLGKMTIRYYNMKRIPVNDKRGLEFVLLISILSFLDKIEDENSQRKKSSEANTTTTVIANGQGAEHLNNNNNNNNNNRNLDETSSGSGDNSDKNKNKSKEKKIKKAAAEKRLEEVTRQQVQLERLKQVAEDEELARKLAIEERNNFTRRDDYNRSNNRNNNYSDNYSKNNEKLRHRNTYHDSTTSQRTKKKQKEFYD